MLQILLNYVDYFYIPYPKEYHFSENFKLSTTKFLKIPIIATSTRMGLYFFVMMANPFRQTSSYSIHYFCMILRINTKS
jgi:hypothetical protein